MHCSIDCFTSSPIFRPQQVYYSKFGVMCLFISKISSSLKCTSMLSFINFRSKLYFSMFDYSIAAFPSLSIFSLHICPALRPSIVQWRASYISYHHYHHRHRHHHHEDGILIPIQGRRSIRGKQKGPTPCLGFLLASKQTRGCNQPIGLFGIADKAWTWQVRLA